MVLRPLGITEDKYTVGGLDVSLPVTAPLVGILFSWLGTEFAEVKEFWPPGPF